MPDDGLATDAARAANPSVGPSPTGAALPAGPQPGALKSLVEVASGLERLARTLEVIFGFSGALAVLGGLALAFGSEETFNGSSYETTHPYVGIGIGVAIVGLLQCSFFYAAVRTMRVVGGHVRLHAVVPTPAERGLPTSGSAVATAPGPVEVGSHLEVLDAAALGSIRAEHPGSVDLGLMMLNSLSAPPRLPVLWLRRLCMLIDAGAAPDVAAAQVTRELNGSSATS